jgi:tRNA(adenine34) deaminase
VRVFFVGLFMNLASPFGPEQDKKYMKQALTQARKALVADEVPVGALVVDEQGVVIGRGYNLVMKQCSQRAHAEAIAIAQAGKKQGDWRLNGCVLYVTLEPCAMCMALIYLSRISTVVYGATSPLFGYQQDMLDNGTIIRVYKKDVQIVPGIMADEAVSLLKQFFQKKRKKGEYYKSSGT